MHSIISSPHHNNNLSGCVAIAISTTSEYFILRPTGCPTKLYILALMCVDGSAKQVNLTTNLSRTRGPLLLLTRSSHFGSRHLINRWCCSRLVPATVRWQGRAGLPLGRKRRLGVFGKDIRRLLIALPGATAGSAPTPHLLDRISDVAQVAEYFPASTAPQARYNSTCASQGRYP
jgi:hypothetical protein